MGEALTRSSGSSPYWVTAVLVAALVPMAAAFPVLAQGSEPAASTNPHNSDATRFFREGVKLYAEKKYDEALAAFRQSNEAFVSPNAGLGIARCMRDLGRLADAVAQYEEVIADANVRIASAPEYGQARDAAQAELERIAGKVGRLRVEFDPPLATATARLNGRAVSNVALARSVPLLPGTAALEVAAPGYEAVQRQLEVSAGEVLEIAVKWVPLASAQRAGVDAGAGVATPGPAQTEGPNAGLGGTDSSSLGTWGWVGAGLGVAGLGASAVFYLLGDSQYDDLVRECVDKPCSASARDEIESTGRTYETAMVVSLVAGASCLALGALLLLLDSGEGDAGADADGASMIMPEADVTTRGATFGVRGVF